MKSVLRLNYPASNSITFHPRLAPLGAFLICALFWSVGITTEAQVPATDTTLLPVITDGLPVIGATTSVSHDEGQFASNTVLALPLLQPYGGPTSSIYWDDLISEQQQARLPVIMLITSGYPWNGNGVIPNSADGGANPYYLPNYFAALQRHGAANSVKCGCCPEGVGEIYWRYYNLPAGSPVDFSNEDSWNSIWWNFEIGPWFQNVPQSYWFKLRGGVPVEFWGLGATGSGGYINQQGNISRFWAFLNAKVQALYGVSLSFEECDTNTRYDTTLPTYPRLIAMNPWFTSSGYGFTDFVPYGQDTAVNTGTLIPGFNNGNAANIILRNNPSGTGVMGDTMKAGLAAAVAGNSDLASIEGWIDPGEGASSYRCSTESVTAQSGNWLYPNQYVNIVRSYTDLRTTTLRLEAESCDKYNDPGGIGGVYRRAPATLDITTLPSGNGWAVDNTKGGEWIEWDGISFSSGNYNFPICYSSTTSHSFQLLIDGVSQGTVSVPSTGSLNTYSTAYVTAGTKAINAGIHTLRLVFGDGGPNVDWMFIKKEDPMMSFKSSLTGKYITASQGGNDELVSTQGTAGAWENFTVDDQSSVGGGIASGDSVDLQSYDGLYVTANGGGGIDVLNNRRNPGGWELLNIVKISGSGTLTNGSQVAIKTSTGNYLTVEKDGTVDASGTSVGLAQTFTISISPLATPPAPPTNLTATAVSGSQINLAWRDNATNETGYIVKQSIDGGNTFAPIVTLGPNTTSYSVAGLAGSTSYIYEVLATNATANSDVSNDASATTAAGPPMTPLDLVASIAPTLTGASTILQWNASPGATSYTIDRSTVSEGSYAPLGTSTGPSYTDATGIAGKTYYYEVKATNASGASSWSSQISSTPNFFSQADVGTGTGSGSYSNGIFTLTGSGGDINGPSDTFHYCYLPLTGDCTVVAHLASFSSSNGWAKSGIMIRQSLATGDPFAMMSLTLSNGDNFQYRLTPGTASGFNARIAGVVAPQWLMLVRSGNNLSSAYSADGITWVANGPPDGPQVIPMTGTVLVGLVQTKVSTSTFDSVTITPNQEELAAVPTGLAASLVPASGNSSVQLSWTSVPGTSWYNVLRSTTSGGPYTSLSGPSVNTYTDTTAVNGTTYYYVVTATNGLGTTANSAQLTVTDAAVPLGQTISLQANANYDWVTAGSSPLIANATSVGTAQSFTVVDESSTYGPGYVALLASANGDYVTAANSTTALIANSTTVGPTQVFYWNAYGNGNVSLSSYNNLEWVCADNSGTSPLIANRTKAGTWETYTLKIW